MAITDWLVAPTQAKVPEGVDALHRIWVLADATAAPITPYNVPGVQNITTSAFTPQTTKEVYQQGSGEDGYFEHKRRYRHDFTVQLLSGDVMAFIGRIKGLTHTASELFALPSLAHSEPLIHWEIIVRSPSGTHLFSKVYRDLILKEWAFNSPMEDEIVDIPFYSKSSPFTLYTGSELVVDKFAGDGSTLAFTLSGTPLDLVNATDRELDDWYWDEIVSINYKTSAEPFCTYAHSGWSNVATALTATVAPAASSVVTATYAKATA